MKRLRTAVMSLVGVAIGGALLWYALRSVSAADVARLLAGARWGLALPFLLLLLGFCVAKAWRWSLLLTPVTRASTLDLLPVVVVGYAGATLLPLQLGELVRSAAAQRRFRVPLTAVLASVAVERTFDLLAAAVLLGLAIATNPAIAPYVGAFAWVLGISIVALFVLLRAYARDPRRLVDGLLPPVQRFAPRIAAWLREHLLRGSAGAQALRSRAVFASATVLSFVQLAFTCGCVALSFAACGVSAPPSAVITVMVLATVGMSLPSAPGYVGSIQAAYVVGLAAYGVPAPEAVAASLFYHVLTCGTLLLAGLACLPVFRLSPVASRLSPEE